MAVGGDHFFLAFTCGLDFNHCVCFLAEVIQQRDTEVAAIMEEKVTLFSKVLQLQAGEDAPVMGNTRKLFRTESTDSYRGEKLITEAIKEGEIPGRGI